MNAGVAEALRHLAALCEVLDGPLQVEVRHAGFRAVLTITTHDTESPQVGTDLAQQILDTMRLLDKPLKGRAIASRAGRQYTSHFRRILTDLREAGSIILTDEGYALPDVASQT
jgi:hypothetical protein